MYGNYSPFYFHLWLPFFLSNCLQNTQNAVLDNLFCFNFLEEDTPSPSMRPLQHSLISPHSANTHLPMQNPIYGAYLFGYI